MKYIIIAIAAAFVAGMMRKEKEEYSGNEVYTPKMVMYMGIGMIIIAAGLPLAAEYIIPQKYLPMPPVVYFFLLIILAGGYLMCITEANWRIAYDEDGFTYRTIFRKTYKFSYADIADIYPGQQMIRIRTASKTLRFSADNIGQEAFVRLCRQKTGERINP